MSDFRPHHIDIDAAGVAGNNGRGRFFLLPGSAKRAQRIAQRFEDATTHPCHRRLDVHTGTLHRDGRTLDVGVVSTGIGSPTLEVVVTELIMLGAHRLLRVGTAGSLQPDRIRTGDLVVASGAVRDEHTSEAYLPREVPALAHPDWVLALCNAARKLDLADRCYVGAVHSKDSMYGREFKFGPLAERNARYLDALRATGVLATEMECSALFILAAVHGSEVAPLSQPTASPAAVKAGGILAVVGDDSPFASPDQVSAAEERAIDLAFEALWELDSLEV